MELDSTLRFLYLIKSCEQKNEKTLEQFVPKSFLSLESATLKNFDFYSLWELRITAALCFYLMIFIQPYSSWRVPYCTPVTAS